MKTRADVQKLIQRAEIAKQVRDAQQDPNVVALREERWRTIVSYCLWISLILGLLFTMTNVQHFAVLADNLAAAKLDPGRPPLDPTSATWWAYWLVDPMLSLALVALLFAEQRTTPKGIFLNPTARIGKWVVLAAIYVANTGPYWWVFVPLAIFLHSLPVIGVAFVAEILPDAQDKISQTITKWEADYRQRRTEELAERARLAQEARASVDTEHENEIAEARTKARVDVIRAEANVQVAQHAATAMQARRSGLVDVSDRSGEASQAVPGSSPRPSWGAGSDRSEGGSQNVPGGALRPVRGGVSGRSETRSQNGPVRRSGTSRKPPSDRSRKKVSPRQRTDDDLLQDVRELVHDNGGEQPTKYQLKQTLGIGNERAARLLEQLDPEPLGAPASNGAAKAGGR